MDARMNFTRFIFVCFVAVALSSCLDDGDGVEYGYYYSTIGIIEENGDGGCYVETDTGKKLLVSNPRDVLAEVSDGDRVYVEFNLTGGKPQGYDDEIDVFYVYSVLVKDPVHLKAENAKEIGDDNISVSEIWTTDEYLNFRFQFYSGGDKTHYVNLVTVDEPKRTEDGYVYVEFRHNANYDSAQYPYSGIVSFNTDSFLSENPSLKGFVVRVKTYASGEQFYKIDFDKAGNNGEVKFSKVRNVGSLE